MACALVVFGQRSTYAQLVINQSQPPSTLVQNVLMGSGVFSSNILFNGYPGATIPIGEEGTRFGRFNGASSNLGLASGVVLCAGNASVLPGPNDQSDVGSGGFPFNATPDADLAQVALNLAGGVGFPPGIYNKSILEFDFIPTHDMVRFRYVFTSEEYGFWACSSYNDVFAFLISGPGISGPYSNNAMNIATLPFSSTPVAINTVNSGMNASNANGPVLNPFYNCFVADLNWFNNTQYFIHNGGWGNNLGGPQTEPPYCCDPHYIQHNGLTVAFESTAAVQCGETYHIKLAIGNVGDWRFPSAVFLEQGSFTSSDRFGLDVQPGPNVETTATDTVFIESDCDSVYLRFHRYGGHYLDEDLTITAGGAATGGVDYAPALPSTVYFNQWDTLVVVPVAVPVDADDLEDLVVTIVTCDGLKLQTYIYTIDQRPPLEVQLEDVQLVCPDEMTLTPEVTGGSEDPALLTYLWSTGETTPSITVDVMVTTQFWVTVRDSCWTLPVTDSAWVFVPVHDPLQLAVTPDTAIPCLATANLEVVATGGAGDYTYEWILNGAAQGTDPQLEVPAAVVPVYYVIHVTDACDQVKMDSVLVSQAPPVPLVITLTPDTAIPCLSTAELEVIATGGGGVISYTWNQGGGIVGTEAVLTVPAANGLVYTVDVTDQCGQTQSGSVLVTTGPTPPLSLVAEGDTTLCPNDDMVLTVLSVSGGGGAYTYSWSPPDAGGADQPQLNVNVPDDRLFTVTVTDECGNSADTTLLAMVQDLDPVVVAVNNDTIVCPGELVGLFVEITGGAGEYSVVWAGIGTGQSVLWRAGSHDIIGHVNVTDACGTVASDSVALGVYPASAHIDASQLGDSDWAFEARVEPETGGQLEWDLGDGTTVLNETVVTHTYTDTEAHWVYLYLSTPEGCMAMDSVQTTPPAATIYFPNAFSPNGDGINETFGGDGRLISRYELTIFDRWGGIMFESKDLDVRWDGTMDGEEVMNGVYQYKFFVKGLELPLRQGFGHVVLLR